MICRAADRPQFKLVGRTTPLGLCLAIACASLLSPIACPAQSTAQSTTSAAQPKVKQQTFKTPKEASEALISAAERFDVPALKEILGPDGVDLVVTDDPVLDKNQSTAFAAHAREKSRIVVDPKKPNVATLNVGAEDWPMPIPLVKKGDGWRFDTKMGRQEVLYRRVGRNELDAIQVCRGYVEAQYEYASQKHDGSLLNQYAQRVLSTPGRHDGLAWQAADGSWQGPVGETIAHLISEGYQEPYRAYHGYYFRILKGQGPAAPMGQMNFLVKGLMIGGFALVAAPADYGVTGVKTFIVSHSGIVYEKDLGPKTLEQFREMDRYNPDSTWKPVSEP
jgi:hypothetical protein